MRTQRQAIMAATVIAILSGSRVLFAQTEAPQTKLKVVLVELFTSEGCSSCPPADALLRNINGKRNPAGQLIVGISEHVTYWNSLGWTDPFSAMVYTDRQNAYGMRLGLDSVYTPQMVVNGTEQFVGSDQRSLLKALTKELDQASPVELKILSMSADGNALTVKFSTTGGSGVQGDVVAVLADDTDQSSVLHGENSGRTLTQVAVARSIARVAKLQAGPQQTVQIKLPTSFVSGAGHHLILFAQAPGNGRVLGADAKPL